MSEDTEEYQVEGIVGRKETKGTLYYRVKWAGYTNIYNTWEPARNLQHLNLLIEQFEEKDEFKPMRKVKGRQIRCRGDHSAKKE